MIKPAISMVIFNSYVKLSEDKSHKILWKTTISYGFPRALAWCVHHHTLRTGRGPLLAPPLQMETQNDGIKIWDPAIYLLADSTW